MWAGRAAATVGDDARAISLLERGADAFRSLKNMAGLSATLSWLGGLVGAGRGPAMLAEAVQLARDLGDAELTAQALHNRAIARSEHDEFSSARRDFEEALVLFRAAAKQERGCERNRSARRSSSSGRSG